MENAFEQRSQIELSAGKQVLIILLKCTSKCSPLIALSFWTGKQNIFSRFLPLSRNWGHQQNLC